MSHVGLWLMLFLAQFYVYGDWHINDQSLKSIYKLSSVSFQNFWLSLDFGASSRPSVSTDTKSWFCSQWLHLLSIIRGFVLPDLSQITWWQRGHVLPSARGFPVCFSVTRKEIEFNCTEPLSTQEGDMCQLWLHGSLDASCIRPENYATAVTVTLSIMFF